MNEPFYTIACSECFSDIGLKLDAERIGIEQISECPNCHKKNGKKLNRNLLNDLAYGFFVNGTSFRTTYGGAPAVQYNEYHFNKDTLDVPDWLKKDTKLIGQLLKIGFFHYGPRLWAVGHVTPLEELQNESLRQPIIHRIINEYPTVTLSKGTIFYRVRKSPEVPLDYSEYDSPPDKFLGNGRLDSVDVPIMYASQDLEACIHECRVTIEDELYVATLALIDGLKILDLSDWIEESATEFESLSIAVHFLFRAPGHSYEILREITRTVQRAGYDGMIYPSYFTSIHRSGETIKNIAIFGRPINDGKVEVTCINRVMLSKVSYDINFGPSGF